MTAFWLLVQNDATLEVYKTMSTMFRTQSQNSVLKLTPTATNFRSSVMHTLSSYAMDS